MKIENSCCFYLSINISYLDQKLQLFIYLIRRYASTPTEVNKRLSDGEFTVQSNLLRHIADSRTWYARSFGTWSTTQNPDLTGIETSAADDA